MNADALARTDRRIAGGFRDERAGRVIRVELQDGDGKPAPANGVATVSTEYDSAGNATRVSLLGPDGQLPRNRNEWVVQEIARNPLGEIIGRKYSKLGSDDKLAVLSEWSMSYDEFGHPSEIRIAATQNSRSALRHDARGNVTEETTLDPEGHPVVNERGYAIKRLSYSFEPQGMRWEESYFDAAGGKTYGTGGYHRFIVEFNSTGVLRRQITADLDQTRYHYYRDISEPEYDALGRERRSVLRFENEKGELALDAGLPYAAIEGNYDDNGRAFLVWKLGCPEAAGAPSFSIDSEWHRTGARKRRVRQACDANRKPLAVVSHGIAARSEEEYDEIDRLERMYETGFDEKALGFSTREAKFSNGTLQSVTHKRGDGAVLDSVRVIITAVQPQQPKAAELRPGDQLLLANDKPVHSAYDWVFAINFPGGWIEVLRDGQRVRIEGFTAGALGISLEDRAPVAK